MVVLMPNAYTAGDKLILRAEWDGARVVFHSDTAEMQARIVGWERDGLLDTGDGGKVHRTLVTDPEFIARLRNHLARESPDAEVRRFLEPLARAKPRSPWWVFGLAAAGAVVVQLLIWVVRNW